MKRLAETKKFNGKTYHFVTLYFRKEDAQAAQSRLQKKGYSTRITKVKSSISGYNYRLYTRRR